MLRPSEQSRSQANNAGNDSDRKRITAGPFSVGYSVTAWVVNGQIQIRLEWNDHPAQIAKLGIYPASAGLHFQLFAPGVHSEIPPPIGYANACADEALPRPFDAPRPPLRDVERGTRSILRLAPSARAVLASVFSVRLFSLPDSICAIIG